MIDGEYFRKERGNYKWKQFTKQNGLTLPRKRQSIAAYFVAWASTLSAPLKRKPTYGSEIFKLLTGVTWEEAI